MQQFKGINIQKRKIISLKKLGNSFFTFLHKDNTEIYLKQNTYINHFNILLAPVHTGVLLFKDTNL